jgi:acyl dehydratase
MSMPTPLRYSAIEPGQWLPELGSAPISRTTLALYAGASGDHNPNHIDIDAAHASGMDDVFVHGMLSMAYMGRLLTGWCPQSYIRHFEARFVSIAHVGDAITCRGQVIGKEEVGNEKRVSVLLQAADQHGDIKLTGSATIIFPFIGD